MVDIVFINSPIVLYKDKKSLLADTDPEGDEKSYYPMNILYLASYLEKEGFSVQIIDPTASRLSLHDIKKKIEKLNPKVIGLTAMTVGVQSVVVLAKELKKRGRIIGLGGVHITCDPTFMDRFPYFDFGVVGEGETVLARIMKKIKQGQKVKGLFYGEPIEDLDQIPFPARHLIDYKIYRRDEMLKIEVPAAGILASRGCPFNCLFCAIPARGKKVRFRSAKNIVDEMEQVYDKCQGAYSFVDDCFTVNKQRVVDLCQEIITRGLKTRWIATTRADVLDLEMATMLKKAGCTDLYFGVESGNERIRNEVIGKRLTTEKIYNAIKVCRQVGILSNLFLMVGFPTEGKKEMWDTITIGSRVKADIIGIHITIPMPGSRIYTYAIENKIIPADIVDQYARGDLGWGWRNHFPLFVPKELTLKDLVWAKKMAYIYFYLSPGWWFRRVQVWFTMPQKFVDDLKLFKIAGHVFMTGGTKGQLS